MRSQLNNMGKTILGFTLSILFSCGLYAQSYKFSRSIRADKEGWYSVKVPQELGANCTSSLEEIRLVNRTDGTEVPYKVYYNTGYSAITNLNYVITNAGVSAGNYQFDVKPASGELPTKIVLNIPLSNYEYYVSVEVSNDRREWIRIVDSTRLVGWVSDHGNFQNTELQLPSTEASIYRVIYHGVGRRIDRSIELFSDHSIPGNYDTLTSQITKVREEGKRTVVDFEFEELVELDAIVIDAESKNKFHRMAWLAAERSNGDYINVTGGIGQLDSELDNTWPLRLERARRFRLTIENLDSPPITVTGFRGVTMIKEIAFKLDAASDLDLFYGLIQGDAPVYDTYHFDSEIKGNLTRLKLGDPITLEESQESEETDLSWLLYVLLALVVGLMAYAGIKMMKE